MYRAGQTGTVLYRVIDVIVKMAFLQLLWAGFTLAGGIIFGVFPATVALYDVIRRWESDENGGESTFQMFLSAYRKGFWKNNLLGSAVLAAGAFLTVDLWLASSIDHAAGFVLTFLFSVLLGFYILVLLFLFPVKAYFDESFFNYLKYALLIGMSSIPYAFFIAAAWIAVLSFFIFVLPAAAVFFAVSVLAVINVKVAAKAIRRIELKQHKSKKEAVLSAQ